MSTTQRETQSTGNPSLIPGEQEWSLLGCSCWNSQNSLLQPWAQASSLFDSTSGSCIGCEQQRRERAESVFQVAAVVVMCRDRKVDVTVNAPNCSITDFEVQLDKKRAGVFCWHCVLFKVYTP